MEVDILLQTGAKKAPFHCFGDGLVQKISYDFLSGLRHLHSERS